MDFRAVFQSIKSRVLIILKNFVNQYSSTFIMTKCLRKHCVNPAVKYFCGDHLKSESYELYKFSDSIREAIIRN